MNTGENAFSYNQQQQPAAGTLGRRTDRYGNAKGSMVWRLELH